MVFATSEENLETMTKGATLFVAFIVLFTFSIWMGLVAGGFGLIVGLFAAVFGVMAGAIGAIFGVIGYILKAIFGGIFNWGWTDSHIFFPHFHFNGYAIAAIIIVTLLVIRKKRQSS